MHRMEVWVPSHLRRTYPSVFTLTVAALAIAIYPGAEFDYRDVITDMWAGITVGFLFYGWVKNRVEHTFTGLWMSAGLWASIVVDIIIDRELSLVTTQLVLFSVAYLTLSVGAWWLMRIDPLCPVGHPRKKQENV